MSDQAIMIIAVIVFVLMVVGLVLTVREFDEIVEDDDSTGKKRVPRKPAA